MPFSIVKTAAFRPMPSVSTPIDGEREGRVLRERADRVADVAQQIAQGLEPPRRPHAAGRFGRQRDVAELSQRRVARVFRIGAVGDPLLRGDGEVRADLLLEILFIEFDGPAARSARTGCPWFTPRCPAPLPASSRGRWR